MDADTRSSTEEALTRPATNGKRERSSTLEQYDDAKRRPGVATPGAIEEQGSFPKPSSHIVTKPSTFEAPSAQALSAYPTDLDPALLQRGGIRVDPVTKKIYEYKSSLEPLERFSLSAYESIVTSTAKRVQQDASSPCAPRNPKALSEAASHGDFGELTTDEIKRAGKIFEESGFVILQDFLSESACEQLTKTMQVLMDQIRSLDTKQVGIRAQKRYTVSDAQRSYSLLHEDAFREALNELYEKGLGALLRNILQAEPRLFHAGAQVVLEGATYYQYLHADTDHVFAPYSRLYAGMPKSYEVQNNEPVTSHKEREGIRERPLSDTGAGDLPHAPLRWLQKLPESLDVNVVLEDWTWESGAPRILPGKHFYEMISNPALDFPKMALPNNLKEETLLFDHDTVEENRLSCQKWWKTSPSILRSQLFPLKKGAVIVRDVNTLHGGCPNLSASQRHMPSFIFEPAAWTEMRNTMASNGEWSWLPRHWGWPQVASDQLVLLNHEFARDNSHLLPDARAKPDDRTEEVPILAQRWELSDFGFDADRLQKLISKREQIFETYKRRDAYYNLDNQVRDDLGQKLEKRNYSDMMGPMSGADFGA